MRIKECLLLIFFVYYNILFSQIRNFQHLENADGISQSEVYTFLEDSKGFMWFGTVDGLNKYDGYNITIFNTNRFNLNSISNNTIRSLAEDSFGRIWIGTDDGLCVYNPLSEKIFQVKIACIDDNTLLQIRSIIVDENHILLGTSSGLLRANITKLDQIGQDFKLINFAENHTIKIFDLTLCKDGSLWILTADALYGMVFQNETAKPLIIEKIVEKRFGNNIALEEDKFENLWIITHNSGFFRYKRSTKNLEHFNENNSNKTVISRKFSDAVIDNNDNLWIASRDKGLLFLNSKKLNDVNPQFENIKNDPYDEKSLNSNLTYSLYVSRNNLLFVGTIGSGINIYDPQQKEFNHIKKPSNELENQSSSNFIRSVYNDQDNNIWFGKQNNGLFIYNKNKNTYYKAGFENQTIFYISDFGSGNSLICSTNGASVVKLVNNKVKIINSNFSNAHFYACKSKDDIIWLASINGVTKCRIVNGNLQVEKIYNSDTNPGVSLNNCRVLFYNKEKNELLVGTEGGGLNILVLDKNQNVVSVRVFKKNNLINSISNNYIRSIIKDSNGDIWIGTFEGLNKLLRNTVSNEITFKSYTIKDGLPNNLIQLIVEDNQKKLWIGTNGGLSKFDFQDESFINYSINEGLQSNEFSEHTVFKKPDGEIIIGGTNGINMFYPQNIISNNILPKTTITKFYLFNNKVEISDGSKISTPLNKSIVLTDSIFLNTDQNQFWL